MVDKIPLPLDNKVHELKLGSSFDAGSNTAFHSIRYDFKPASVDTTKDATVEIGSNSSVTVEVPHVEGSGTSHTVYKGNKRPTQKECVLIIDPTTGEFTLEKISTTLQLKKTRSGTLQSKCKRPPVSASVREGHRPPNLVSFAEDIHSDITNFLSDHKLETSRRPYVTSKYSLSTFEREHKELYLKAKQRLSVNDTDMDNLTEYLCDTFRRYLIGSKNVIGHVQRLEDVCDFVIEKFNENNNIPTHGELQITSKTN